MARTSNRRYPPAICANPNCRTSFEPHDRRQLYCEPQCRINANNDRRFLENETRFSDEKIARRNSKILEFLWNKHKNLRRKMITRSMLDFENFDFEGSCKVMKNSNTGRTIQWFHNYGLEPVIFTEKLFWLHKI